MIQPSTSGGRAAAKAALRARVLAARDGLTPERRAEASHHLIAALSALPECQGARTVMLYLGIKSEFDPLPLVEAALASGRRLVLPRILRGKGELEIRAVGALASDLAVGVWGLREPDPARCPEVSPALIDFVLVPGVAFDRQGGRMGYGAGYYDRLLADRRLRAPRVSALLPGQLVDQVPREAHDIPVDILVLPDRVLRVATADDTPVGGIPSAAPGATP